MPPFADSDFLHPAHGIESPFLQVWGDGLLNPFQGAAIVLVAPDMNVLRIAETGRIDVIEAHREKRISLWVDQPPVTVLLAKGKETV
jgi:hypothetical protein